MDEAVRKLRPDQALEAAGYIRVSLKRQAEGHSPEVQRQAIERLAKQEGYVLALVEEDHERGSKVTRAGYQRIIESVRAGTTHAVIVFMFDRWGRDGAEWLTRAREFERLGVPIISVQEGRDEGGLMRFMRAGMAEEYSRQLAKRVRPNKEDSAGKGVHQGRTPLGYKRVYPPAIDARRRPPAALVPDPVYAPIVQLIFQRYAEGGWSHRRIVDSFNRDPTMPRRPRCGTGTRPRERW
jgi:site-specific DNA recombinase